MISLITLKTSEWKFPSKGCATSPTTTATQKHTQLIQFNKICCVCMGTTPDGNFVNAMWLIQSNTTSDFWLNDFKEIYASFFEEYAKTRVAVLETMS